MTDRKMGADDVFDVTEYMPEVISLWAQNFPGIYSSGLSVDVSDRVDMTNGGKSVAIPTINFLDSDGNASEFKVFTGTALATNGGKLEKIDVALTEYGLPISIIGTTIDQAWKSKDGKTIIDMMTEHFGEKMATAIDKHLLNTIIAGGQIYHRKASDTTLALALLGARGKFGDKQFRASNLVMNGLGGSSLISSHLNAAESGAQILVNGKIDTYLGCNVILSDNLADNHAVVGLNGAISYVIKNVKIHKVTLPGQTFQYEFYFSIAALIPSPNGMKGVVYADLGTPPAVLKTTLTPAAAVTAGAKWSIDGGTTWLDSAASANVTGNTATIKFKAATGYATPADKVLTNLQNGVTTEVSQAYTAS